MALHMPRPAHPSTEQLKAQLEAGYQQGQRLQVAQHWSTALQRYTETIEWGEHYRVRTWQSVVYVQEMTT